MNQGRKAVQAFGFGLGFALNLDAPSSGVIVRKGEYHWHRFLDLSKSKK